MECNTGVTETPWGEFTAELSAALIKTCSEVVNYRHTSEILQAWFQTTAIQQVSK